MRIPAAIAVAALFFCAPAQAADAPKSIVERVYAQIKKQENYEPPRSLFTPRLAKLVADDEADAKGEVGRLDVDPWTNGQDYRLGRVSVSAKSDVFRKDRQIVTVSMVNLGRPQTVIIYFEQQNGRWLIDDFRWTGKDGWVLSLVVKYGE